MSRFSDLAGHPALDLANTVDWRLDDARRSDRLRGYEDAMAWAVDFGLVDEAQRAGIPAAGAEADREFARILALRDAIYATVDDPVAAVEAIHGEYVEAVAAGVLVPAATSWRWEFPVDVRIARRRLALLTFDLVTMHDTERFRRCDDDACGWVFLDTSPRRNRRWCSSADCGNRNRVKAHYARAKG